jgi:hypothetical protein
MLRSSCRLTTLTYNLYKAIDCATMYPATQLTSATTLKT